MSYRAQYLALIVCMLSGLDAQERNGAPEPVGRNVSGEAPPWATLVGSTERTRYHRLQCSVAKRITAANAIWFTDANDAAENGYEPAGCRNRQCRPPLPDAVVPLGELGGPGLPLPDMNPPEVPVPTALAEPESGTGSREATSKSEPVRSKARAAPAPRVQVPPPRLPPVREPSASPVWTGIPPHRELDARRRWDVWAQWTLEKWCERWHVAPAGKIASDAAYSPHNERALLLKFKLMKEQIEDNRKRMRELKAEIDGKTKKKKSSSGS